MKEITMIQYGFTTHRFNGKSHRTNGPASYKTFDGNEWSWWLYGEIHRYYGPVARRGNWYIHGKWLRYGDGITC